MSFVELSAQSNFSFLTGGSHPEEYMRRSADLGLAALAIADDNSVSGIVRAHLEAREIARDAKHATTPRLIPATKIVLSDGFGATALPTDRAAWGRLCRLLSLGRLRAPKGGCDLGMSDVLEWGAGMIWLLWPPNTLAADTAAWHDKARQMIAQFPGQVNLIMAPHYDGQDRARFESIAQLGDILGVGTVASAATIMHHGARRRLCDVLSCIRLGTTIDRLGRRAQANAEQRLRSLPEMLRLFAWHELAVHRTGQIADRLHFRLDALRYEYPSELTGTETAQDRLARLTQEGLAWRYPAGVS